jgi:hypothetical protein
MSQPEHIPSTESLCDCTTNCCLHAYADAMLEMLYQYAGECAECEGTGEVVVSSVQRDVDWWDETKGPCSACADIREVIKLADPCGDRLQRVRAEISKGEEVQDDIAF